MQDKVYRVTVTLEVHGQPSKEAVKDFLDEALEIDGIILVNKGNVVLKKEEN